MSSITKMTKDIVELERQMKAVGKVLAADLDLNKNSADWMKSHDKAIRILMVLQGISLIAISVLYIWPIK